MMGQMEGQGEVGPEIVSVALDLLYVEQWLCWLLLGV